MSGKAAFICSLYWDWRISFQDGSFMASKLVLAVDGRLQFPFTWPSPSDCLSVLIVEWLAFPRTSNSRDQGKNCNSFHNLALDIVHCHFIFWWSYRSMLTNIVSMWEGNCISLWISGDENYWGPSWRLATIASRLLTGQEFKSFYILFLFSSEFQGCHPWLVGWLVFSSRFPVMNMFYVYKVV